MEYTYECRNCNQRFDVEKPMTEATSTERCPICYGKSIRIYYAPIVKGDTVVKDQ